MLLVSFLSTKFKVFYIQDLFFICCLISFRSCLLSSTVCFFLSLYFLLYCSYSWFSFGERIFAPIRCWNSISVTSLVHASSGCDFIYSHTISKHILALWSSTFCNGFSCFLIYSFMVNSTSSPCVASPVSGSIPWFMLNFTPSFLYLLSLFSISHLAVWTSPSLIALEIVLQARIFTYSCAFSIFCKKSGLPSHS